MQVQGVDRGMLESDFSEVYNLTVVGSSMIEMPTSAGVGREVQVRILDNSGQDVDFGSGASVEKKEVSLCPKKFCREPRLMLKAKT